MNKVGPLVPPVSDISGQYFVSTSSYLPHKWIRQSEILPSSLAIQEGKIMMRYLKQEWDIKKTLTPEHVRSQEKSLFFLLLPTAR